MHDQIEEVKGCAMASKMERKSVGQASRRGGARRGILSASF